MNLVGQLTGRRKFESRAAVKYEKLSTNFLLPTPCAVFVIFPLWEPFGIGTLQRCEGKSGYEKKKKWCCCMSWDIVISYLLSICQPSAKQPLEGVRSNPIVDVVTSNGFTCSTPWTSGCPFATVHPKINRQNLPQLVTMLHYRAPHSTSA